MLDRTTPPPIHSALFAFRKPVEHVLRNDVPVSVIEAPGLGAIRIDFVFSAGQWHQARKLQALFANRMLREGCRGYSATEFAERLDYYGAWLDLSVAMNRSFVTLYTLKKHFANTIELVHRMLTEPTYDEKQFNTIRANNKAQQLVNLKKGEVIAMRALRRSIYGDAHPCGTQVHPEDYDTLQLSDAVSFYHQHYGSSTCHIYISGDVDNSLLSQVESLFGNEEWGTSKTGNSEKLISDDNNAHPSSLSFQLEGAAQDSIRMGTLLMDVNDPDYLSTRILTTVLGGYFGSRLMKNIREEKGYTYHIGADLITNTSLAMLMIHCEAQAGKSNEVIEEIRQEMYRLQTEPISNEELRMVCNYMTGEICRNYESAFSLADAYIFMHHLGLPQTHLEHTVEAIRTIDATRLQQLAQQYLRPENLHSVVVHP